MQNTTWALKPNILATLCVAMLLFLIGGWQNASAQCNGDCEETWSVYMHQTVRLSNNCVLLVAYKVRFCEGSPSSCQLYFDSLTSICCPPGQSLPSLAELVRQVARKIFDTYSSYSCQEGFGEFRVKFPSCWIAGGGGAHFYGCITEPCCELYGTPGSEPTPGYPDPDTCEDGDCTYVCGP